MAALGLNFILEFSLVFLNRVFAQYKRTGHREIETQGDSVPPWHVIALYSLPLPGEYLSVTILVLLCL